MSYIGGYAGAIFTTLHATAGSIVVFALITPAQGKTCLSGQATEDYQNYTALLVPVNVVNLALDLYIWALPLIAVSNLQMPTRR